MNYGQFSSALGSLRRGPSPAELAAWLGVGALGGVADSMERRRQEAREDARYRAEMAIRQKYQDAQLSAQEAAQRRADAEFKAEYGGTEYGMTAPVPTTTLPEPSNFLAPPRAKPFEQAPMKADFAPAPRMVPRFIPGFKSRELDIREKAQKSALAIQELEGQKLQVEISDAKDPQMKALKIKNLDSQIAAHQAAAASAYANAGESKARAEAIGLETTTSKLAGPWERVMKLYLQKFGSVKDPLTGEWATPPNAPTVENWVSSWPVAMRRSFGISEKDLLEMPAQPPPGHPKDEQGRPLADAIRALRAAYPDATDDEISAYLWTKK